MKITNRLGMSAAWVNAVSKDTYDKKGWMSVTGLIKPPRVHQLYERHDEEIVEDVTDRLWLLLGEAAHYVLEKGADENAITEERLVMNFEGREISLKPDRVELIPESNPPQYHLKDFKFTTVWSVIYPTKEDWIAQLNLYAYFLRQIDINVTRISVECALKDWKIKDYMLDKENYPPNDMAIIKIPIWSTDQCEQFLRERIKIHSDAEKLPDDELPKCTNDERWASSNKWAVINPTTATNKGKPLQFCRASKNCNSEAEAKAYVAAAKNSSILQVQFRAGESRRCENYCSASKFCKQYNTEINPAF